MSDISKEKNKEPTDEDIARMCLDNLDVVGIFELARQVSEKYLDQDNELYKYFHKKIVFGDEDEKT